MSISVDDARHSVLSKARTLSQAGFEPFLASRSRTDRILPRDQFGTYTVREVDVKSALTDFALAPGTTWSLNPYMGCSHACVYCYVPDVAHVERPRWGSYVVVKRNLPKVLARELRRRPMRDVFMSSATDPYQPAEATHLVTRRCLQQLYRVDWPVRILTRSPLVQRDVDLIGSFHDVSVGLSVPTVDDAARRVLEPAAPPIAGRLAALRELADVGLEPFANLAPAYPLTGGLRPDDVACAFAEAGVSVVYAGRWNYLECVLPVLHRCTRGTLYADFVRAVTDRAYFDRYFAALGGAFRRAGVRFEIMRGPREMGADAATPEALHLAQVKPVEAYAT